MAKNRHSKAIGGLKLRLVLAVRMLLWCLLGQNSPSQWRAERGGHNKTIGEADCSDHWLQGFQPEGCSQCGTFTPMDVGKHD